MIIRNATLKDAKRIAQIYNQGIKEQIATLETQLRDEKERKGWLLNRDSRHPVFVAEDNASVIGWASINLFNLRNVYQYVGDISVYIDKHMRGKGIGTLLLKHVEEKARKLKYHKLVIATFPFNVPAVSLYKKQGFRKVGVYKEQGFLHGKWVDVMIMEKIFF